MAGKKVSTRRTVNALDDIIQPKHSHREFIRYKNGKHYWLDAKYREHDLELMEDSHLFNAIQFLYDWAADKDEDRNLELSIMAHEENRRDELKKTEAGKLLYTAN